VTASIGACFVGTKEPVDSAIKRANEALYRAKSEGRDRWVMG
jgi:PleD family two-component response regulator